MKCSALVVTITPLLSFRFHRRYAAFSHNPLTLTLQSYSVFSARAIRGTPTQINTSLASLKTEHNVQNWLKGDLNLNLIHTLTKKMCKTTKQFQYHLMHELNNCYFPFLLFKTAEQTRRGIRSLCTFVNIVRALSRHAFFFQRWREDKDWHTSAGCGPSDLWEDFQNRVKSCQESRAPRGRADMTWNFFWLKHSQSATSYWTRLDGVHLSIRPSVLHARCDGGREKRLFGSHGKPSL